MKIFNCVQIPKVARNIAFATPLLFASTIVNAQQNSLQQDVFEKSEEFMMNCVADSMLVSPEVQMGKDIIYPAVVVDLSEGRLYHYDLGGNLQEVFPIASGKKSTPTQPGLKIINGIEKYPYSTAPKATKRYKNPNDYGTHLLNLSDVDPKTGEIIGSNGQFVHGTFKRDSIGTKASKGCVRVYNEVIDYLATELEKGQYILIRE